LYSSAMWTPVACRGTNSSSHTTFLVTRCTAAWVQTEELLDIYNHILSFPLLFPQLKGKWQGLTSKS